MASPQSIWDAEIWKEGVKPETFTDRLKYVMYPKEGNMMKINLGHWSCWSGRTSSVHEILPQMKGIGPDTVDKLAQMAEKNNFEFIEPEDYEKVVSSVTKFPKHLFICEKPTGYWVKPEDDADRFGGCGIAEGKHFNKNGKYRGVYVPKTPKHLIFKGNENVYTFFAKMDTCFETQSELKYSISGDRKLTEEEKINLFRGALRDEADFFYWNTLFRAKFFHLIKEAFLKRYAGKSTDKLHRTNFDHVYQEAEEGLTEYFDRTWELGCKAYSKDDISIVEREVTNRFINGIYLKPLKDYLILAEPENSEAAYNKATIWMSRHKKEKSRQVSCFNVSSEQNSDSSDDLTKILSRFNDLQTSVDRNARKINDRIDQIEKKVETLDSARGRTVARGFTPPGRSPSPARGCFHCNSPHHIKANCQTFLESLRSPAKNSSVSFNQDPKA